MLQYLFCFILNFLSVDNVYFDEFFFFFYYTAKFELKFYVNIFFIYMGSKEASSSDHER